MFFSLSHIYENFPLIESDFVLFLWTFESEDSTSEATSPAISGKVREVKKSSRMS